MNFHSFIARVISTLLTNKYKNFVLSRKYIIGHQFLKECNFCFTVLYVMHKSKLLNLNIKTIRHITTLFAE